MGGVGPKAKDAPGGFLVPIPIAGYFLIHELNLMAKLVGRCKGTQ